MSLIIGKVIAEATIQAAPRTGLRHLGVPASGPADPLSFALANRLVGNTLGAPALEITRGPLECKIDQATTIALTGAPCEARLNGTDMAFHETVHAGAGAELRLQPASLGLRTYLAVAGGFEALISLTSASTYLPASLGGLKGRALRTGDHLPVATAKTSVVPGKTPQHLRPHFATSWTLRAYPGAEFDRLSQPDQSRLFEEAFTISRRANRMGLALQAEPFTLTSDGKMKSVAVFPGTLQCPENGLPFLLSCDAQTTGGYPRLASVARCDRHLIGQLRPGDRVRFLRRTPAQAAKDLAAKTALFSDWLPGFRF